MLRSNEKWLYESSTSVVFGEMNGEMNGNNGSPAAGPPRASALLPGEQPPYDTEAT